MIRPSWIAFGWFIAAAVTALFVMAGIAFGVIDDSSGPVDTWTLLAFVAGFLVGGFFAGARSGSRPVIHGLGIGALSLLVWLLANLLFSEAAALASWTAAALPATVAVLFLQTTAAIVGARMGVRWTATGELTG